MTDTKSGSMDDRSGKIVDAIMDAIDEIEAEHEDPEAFQAAIRAVIKQLTGTLPDDDESDESESERGRPVDEEGGLVDSDPDKD